MNYQLLTSAPRYAKLINFSEGYDIKPIIDENPVNFYDIVSVGDKAYISPPTEYWLVDKFNNAYRNFTPPNNNKIFYFKSPTNTSYQIYDNKPNTLLIPGAIDGWKVMPFPPLKPEEEQQQIITTNSINFNLILFILFVIISLITAYFLVMKKNQINYEYEYYS